MLKRFYRIDEAFDAGVDANSINDEIKQRIKATGYQGTPSQKWISGALRALQKSTSEHKHLVSMLYKLERLPEDQREAFSQRFDVTTARNIRELYRVLAKHDLIDHHKAENGETVFNWPSSEKGNKFKEKTKVLSELSELVVKLNDASASAADKLKKSLSAQEFEAAKDYINNLPPNLQKAFNVFMQFDAKELAYFKHLIRVRDDAAGKKTAYTGEVMDKLSMSETASRLNALGVISEDGKLNLPLINDIVELLEEKNFIFKTKKIAIQFFETLKKISADRTYAENDAAKKIAGSDTSLQAADVIEKMTVSQKSNFQKLFMNSGTLRNANVSPSDLRTLMDLKLFKPAGGNKLEFTLLGKAVGIALRQGRGVVGNVVKDVAAVTGRSDKDGPNKAPLEPSTPDTSVMSDRSQYKRADLRNNTPLGGAEKLDPNTDSTQAPKGNREKLMAYIMKKREEEAERKRLQNG